MKDVGRRTGMKSGITPRFLSFWVVVASLAGVLCLLFTALPAAQNRPAGAATVATPRTLDGRPSLTGFWVSRVAGLPDYHTAAPDEKVVVRGADGSIFFDYGGANLQEGTAANTGTPESTPAVRREVSAP